MNHTKDAAKRPIRNTGFLATLSSLFGARGSSAPSSPTGTEKSYVERQGTESGAACRWIERTAPASGRRGNGARKLMAGLFAPRRMLTAAAAAAAAVAIPLVIGAAPAWAFGAPLVNSETATSILTFSATLEAEVNPNSGTPSSYQFEYSTSTPLERSTSAKAPSSPGQLMQREENQLVSADIAPLEPNTTYYFRVVVVRAERETVGEEEHFTTPGPQPPSISAIRATDVTAGAATIKGLINPVKSKTLYHFEYDVTPYGGPEAHGTSAPVPDASAGEGIGGAPVGVRVQDLLPDTTYYFRIVAANAVGTTYGEQGTFSTWSLVSPAMLDDRNYELVSPTDGRGGLIEPISANGWPQAALAGDAITYLAESPLGSNVSGNPQYTQVLSARTAQGGWRSEDIATPHDSAVGLRIGKGQEYRYMTPSLSAAVVEPLGSTPLSPLASERTPYLRLDCSRGAAGECDGTPAAFVPLVNGANVPTGVRFGDQVSFVDATEDLKHVVLSSAEALTEDAGKQHRLSQLYEWSGGSLRLVSVLPSGRPAAEPVVGSDAGGKGAFLGDHSQSMRGAVNTSGSQVVWGTSSGNVYLRLLERDETIQLDVPEAGLPEPETSRFQIATTGGDKIFFTSKSALVAGAGAVTIGSPNDDGDLYEYDVATRTLSDVTLPQSSAGGGHVLGSVLGINEAGTRVYFVAAGAFAPGAKEGANNLYVGEEVGGAWSFSLIAILSGRDQADWGALSGSGENLGMVTSRVSSDGRYLAFMSTNSLTGYDNHDVTSGEPDAEVYLYDIGSGEGGSGHDQPICVSCAVTGEPPQGTEDGGEGLLPPLYDQMKAWKGGWVAASIPGWTPMSGVEGKVLYQSRYLSDNGRLFFDSVVPLVPMDTNGNTDVYEYEPVGVGTCSASEASYHPAMDGCTSLVSSGSSNEESVFLDAGEGGADVFFLTAAKLVGADIHSGFDVYDAHQCTAGLPCAGAAASVQPPCTTTDSCRTAPQAQPSLFGSPPSAAFSGPGNVTPERSCRAFAGRIRRLSHSAKALSRRARQLLRRLRHRPGRLRARSLRRREHRLALAAKHRAQRAQRLAGRTKVCRRNDRRAAG